MQYKFHLNNLRIAPRKVRLIAALIRGSSIEEAEAQLKFQTKRAALPVLKLLKSGAAAISNNFNLSPEDFYVAQIFVDEGPMLKRFMPRAFGRAGAIHKKSSHITLILEERLAPGAKKSKKKAVKKVESKETVAEKKTNLSAKRDAEGREAPRVIKPKGKFEGAAKKVFRRKAIG